MNEQRYRQLGIDLHNPNPDGSDYHLMNIIDGEVTDKMTDKYDPKPHGKPILLLDFDGCIHSYSSGWQGAAVIPDPPVPGIFEWIEAALIYFEIHVYSARSTEPVGRLAMFEYVRKHAGPNSTLAFRVTFTDKKTRPFITIDDRCVRFDGNWSDPQFDPQTLLKFTSWYQRNR